MRRLIIVFALAVLCGVAPRTAVAQPWPVVSPDELAMQAPTIDRNADAEVLLWDVSITDAETQPGVIGTVFQHYLRVKVFTDRGRDAASRIDLRFTQRQTIRDITGRTTAPDGTVRELAASDIRERTILEAEGLKLRVLSFVLPAAVPGSVLEYRWREVRPGQLAHNLVLPLQRPLPVHTVRYRIRPRPVSGYQMRTHVFNAAAQPPLIASDQGSTLIEARRMTAARAEALMPREMAVGTWMFLYYASAADGLLTEQAFWEKWSKAQADAWSGRLKLNDDLARAAAEATAGAATPVEKIQALVRFTRQRVRRNDVRTADPNENARETLKRGTGTGDDVVVLFTALARAAGLDAHLARMPDREVFVAAPRLKLPYFLTRLTTAVRIGTNWAFVDPANEYAPAGRLRWQQEGTYALVFDGKAPQFLGVGTSPREASHARRTGTLRLLADGDLEGDLSIALSGHFAARYREQAEDLTLAERERLLSERIVATMPRAGVGNYRVENLDDPEKPCVVHFSLSVPGFAQRTGTRLRLSAALLPREIVPAFGAVARTRPVHFPFAWTEEDALTIELPEGYEVESTTARRPPLAYKQDVGSMDVRTSVSGRTLSFIRSLTFGGSSVVIPVDEYLPLKVFFDGARTMESATLLLRRRGEDSGQ